ncbi:GspE/PulE family protein [Cysteiniphilum halobium]|uniref:GspE/PulE family protein n=1 Tax=Cysteiniphilum halobium TaxID=2219059 RepID=UPI000E64FDEA|nr:ATPase, T2SS/T4P/T4SS family [Cysteiniphilum halobium]
MEYQQLSDLSYRPNRLLFESQLCKEDKADFALGEANGTHFVALIDINKCHDQTLLNRIANYRLQAKSEYQLNDSKTYFVKPSVLAEARSKVDDGTFYDGKKLLADFDQLLQIAINRKVTDIHVIVQPLGARIEFRQFRELVLYKEYDVQYINSLIAAIYNDQGEEQSKDGEFNPSKIQQTVIERFIDQKKYRIRFSSMNIDSSNAGANKHLLSAYYAPLRILPTDMSAIKPLAELGYRQDQLALLTHTILADSGVVIFSGQLNSGKSTTLGSLLKIIRFKYPSKRVVSVESPPEYIIDGVMQHPVHTSVDMSDQEMSQAYKRAMNACARSDMNIGFINEIRNEDTAGFAKWVVEAGHLFLSTVHAQSALGIVNRLQSFGIERDIVCSPKFIQLLVNQALIQTLCPHCALGIDATTSEDEDTQAMLLRLHSMLKTYVLTDYLSAIRFRNKQGCSHCTGGINGLTVVAEMVKPTGELLTLLSQNKHIDAYLYWRGQGALTVKESAILKVIQGEVCPSSLEAELGAINEVDMLDSLGDVFFKEILCPFLEKSSIEKTSETHHAMV